MENLNDTLVKLELDQANTAKFIVTFATQAEADYHKAVQEDLASMNKRVDNAERLVIATLALMAILGLAMAISITNILDTIK